MSDEEYKNIQETLDLQAIPGFRASIKKSLRQIEKGETYSMDQRFGH
jgi:PHD/YefM family antitoxin component YafN of YafNO toxin-antitoxin module